MIQDIFIPSKISSYYIFHRRVLGFEITTSSVQASLMYFSRNTVVLENSMSIALQDQNSISIINAIKKIATTIGKYDEVVLSLTSSAVIFKELTLPFIGREKIKMIVNYEVEPFLPFSLDEACIDFLMTDEDKEKNQTTVLIAAIRKADLDVYTAYFEKAGVSMTSVTLDMFALYDFYRHTMYVAQAHTSLLLIDFGVDAIRMLYIQKGILKSVRLIPYGLAGMLSKMDAALYDLSSDSLEHILQQNNEQWQDEQIQHTIAKQLIIDFCKQITLSLLFFQKQIKNFTAPAKIICLGAGTQLQGFLDQATTDCQIPVEILDMKRIFLKNNIQVNKKIKIDARSSASLIIPLSAEHYGDINFLLHEQRKSHDRLLNKQLFIALFISIATLVAFYFYSNYQLQQWNTAYNKSKKEMINVLKEHMDVDIKNSQRVSEIASIAQSKLQQTKKVCFSFSQSNNAFLNHLQELCNKIDRASLGLDLKKLSFHDKEIIVQGKINPSALQPDPWRNLDTFKEELVELKGLMLKSIPGELAFTVTLLVKEDQDNNQE